MADIVTYESKNAPQHMRWLAYPVVNGNMQVRCEGATEEEAIAKAQRILDMDNAKAKAANVVNANAARVEAAIKSADPAIEVPVKTGRGQANAGTVWMVHFDKKDKQRVPHARVNEFVANGYVRGGPRTKL